MFSFRIIEHPDNIDLDANRISTILSHIDKSIPIAQQGVIHIAFLPDTHIRQLNHQYRGIDHTTDVLSFHYFDDFSTLGVDEVAGECVFSQSAIVSQAIDIGHSPEQEFEILLIHAILHLLGFDHETDDEYEHMWQYELPMRQWLETF